MKNVKRIMAIALTVVMLCSLSTVAFADALADANKANYDFFVKPATITQGTTEFTVEIGAYDASGKTIDMPMSTTAKASLYASLDAATIAAGVKSKSIATDLNATVDYSSVHDSSSDYLSQFCLDLVFDKEAVSLSKDAPLAEVTFTVPADIAAGTYYITFDSAKYDDLLLSDGTIGQAVSFPVAGKSYALVTVTAAQTEETKDFTGTAAYDNFKGATGDWYLGVWVGTYNVTSGSDAKAIKKISVTFTGDTKHEFVVDKDRNNKDLDISGEGTTEFKIAIVGVPEALKDASVATATIEPKQ